MRNDTVMVRIVGEPFLSLAREYKAACLAATDAQRSFAASRGAAGFWGGDRLQGLMFAGKEPEGWKRKKNARAAMRDVSFPVKGHPEEDALKLVPSRPAVGPVFGDAVVEQYNYFETADPKGHYGSSCVGGFFTLWVGWVGDDLYGRIPHAGKAAAAHLEAHPDHTVEEPAKSWTIPAGLVEISDAQWEFDVARYKLAREEAAKAAAGAVA